MGPGIDEDTFHRLAEIFTAWLLETGATISDNIALADLRDRQAGRGVVATRDIEEDVELFAIPKSAILTLETSSVPPRAVNGLDDPWMSLILSMVFEFLKGTESSWKPYLDILPAHFDTLMFWSAHELSYLQGSMVVNKISKDNANRMFAEQLIPRLRNEQEWFNSSDYTDADLLALCHRMGSTIMAYAFDLEKTSTDQAQSAEDGWEEDDEDNISQAKAMVPLADLLNADADSNNAKLFYEEDRVVMKTVKKVKSGEELFNDYGSLPTADVLRRYGYVTDGYAKYDVVEVSIALIKEVSKEHLDITLLDLEDRMVYLDEQGVLDEAFDISRADSLEGQFPEELCILLSTLVLSRPDFERLRNKEKLAKSTLSQEAQSLLRQVIAHRYAMYRPDLDLSVTPHDFRHAMALTVVRGEKLVLQEAAESLLSSKSEDQKRSRDMLEDEAAGSRKRRRA